MNYIYIVYISLILSLTHEETNKINVHFGKLFVQFQTEIINMDLNLKNTNLFLQKCLMFSETPVLLHLCLLDPLLEFLQRLCQKTTAKMCATKKCKIAQIRTIFTLLQCPFHREIFSTDKIYKGFCLNAYILFVSFRHS